MMRGCLLGLSADSYWAWGDVVAPASGVTAGAAASGAGVVASGATGARTSADGEELSDEVDALSLLVLVLESELEALLVVESLLDEVAAAAGSVAVVVVCAMVSTGTIPRAATKQPAAAIRAKDVMVNSLSCWGGHKDSMSI